MFYGRCQSNKSIIFLGSEKKWFSNAIFTPIVTSNGYKIYPIHSQKYKEYTCTGYYCNLYKNRLKNLNKTPPTQLSKMTNPKKISDFVTRYESSTSNTGMETYDELKYFNNFEQLLEYKKNKVMWRNGVGDIEKLIQVPVRTH